LEFFQIFQKGENQKDPHSFIEHKGFEGVHGGGFSFDTPVLLSYTPAHPKPLHATHLGVYITQNLNVYPQDFGRINVKFLLVYLGNGWGNEARIGNG